MNNRIDIERRRAELEEFQAIRDFNQASNERVAERMERETRIYQPVFHPTEHPQTDLMMLSYERIDE